MPINITNFKYINQAKNKTITSFEPLLELCKNNFKRQSEIDMIIKAYEFASEHHKNQKRKSGEPYLNHLLSTAYIITSWGSDYISVVSGLLHDCVEDQEVTLDELKKEFNGEVAFLVDAVTQAKSYFNENFLNNGEETIRKIISSTLVDTRVIIIKLADRLHNMRTLFSMPRHKQLEIGFNTWNIFSPIAHRLGMTELSSELDDLSFFYLKQDVYKNMEQTINKKIADDNFDLEGTKKRILTLLENSPLKKYRVEYRIKHYWSIYNKIRRKGIILEELSDFYAFKIIVESNDDCYRALGIMHNEFLSINGRFKDYISSPKENFYQSIHTQLINNDGNSFELQIKTENMDYCANYGLASHWRYKDKDNKPDGPEPEFIVKQKLFLDSLKLKYFSKNGLKDELQVSEILEEVFTNVVRITTPKKEIIILPEGSTLIDFAFAIHTDIGLRIKGAYVNTKWKKPEYMLKNGDIVNIITSDEFTCNPGFLNSCFNKRTKKLIKKNLNSIQRNINIQKVQFSQKMLADAIKDSNNSMTEKMFNDNLDILFHYFKIKHNDMNALYDVYADDPENIRTSFQLILKKTSKTTKGLNKPIFYNKNEFDFEDSKKSSEYKYRLCHHCMPLPGESIFATKSKTNRFIIHSTKCHYNSIPEEKQIPVSWKLNNLKDNLYNTTIKVISYANPYFLSTVLTLLENNNIEITSCKSEEIENGSKIILICCIKINNIETLERMFSNIKFITGVTDIKKIYAKQYGKF